MELQKIKIFKSSSKKVHKKNFLKIFITFNRLVRIN